MEQVMKFMTGALMIPICLWGLFVAGLAFLILNGVSVLGVMATIGILLMAIDYPKKEKRK